MSRIFRLRSSQTVWPVRGSGSEGAAITRQAIRDRTKERSEKRLRKLNKECAYF